MRPISVFSLLLTIGICKSDVVKRSDDVDPLENVVAKLTSDLQSLQAQMTAVQNGMNLLKMKVGFVTTLHDEITVAHLATVKFDVVQYNEGSGYDSTSGFFTAPAAGLYSFSFMTETSPGHEAGLRLMKEGHQILYIFGSDQDRYVTASSDTVVQLAQGERVWVESTRVHGSSLRPTVTRFSGFLVHVD